MCRNRNRYVDGRTLESDLSGAPWAIRSELSFQLSPLLREAAIGQIRWELVLPDRAAFRSIYNATKFKSASFKSITATLTAAQKNQAVQLLMDLEIESHAGRKVDWNTNDFDLADSIRHMADHFIGALTTLGDTVDGFESLFPTVADQKQTLLSYGGKVTESNYIEKVEYLLINSDQFTTAIQTILQAQKFIKKN